MKTQREKAVALRFNQTDDDAPRVIASGQGTLAKRIIACAEEHDIPLYREPRLVEALAAVNLGEEIPRPLYEAVAKVLAFVYMLDRKESTGNS